MKVILLSDVKALGKKDDIGQVKEGYAKNFLFTKKLAVPADNKNLNDVKVRKAVEAKQAAARLEEAKELKAKIEAVTVECRIKAGKDGKAFGSVSTKEIAEEAQKQHSLELDKKKLVLSEPIKSLGSYSVPVKIHPEVSAELKVEVLGE